MVKKISFLVPAHNEEKIIEKTLIHLSKINYKNYEVILGLDGCTDNTEKIVKKFVKKYPKIFRYYILNERKGKPAVLNKIIKKATGDIIIINDVDWLFSTKYEDGINKMVKIFENEKIGGIADSYPVEWDKKKMKKANLGYKMVVYSSFFWFQFQREKLTFKKNNLTYVKEPTMFLTNIFRKKLYKENSLLGDDFERTKNIMDNNFQIILFEDINMPRMIATYDKILIKDLFRQKIRTAIARRQLKHLNKTSANMRNYFFPVIFYLLKESFKKGIGVFFIVILWIKLTSLATLFSKFKKIDTKKGWALRATR